MRKKSYIYSPPYLYVKTISGPSSCSKSGPSSGPQFKPQYEKIFLQRFW
jgi:hypothetical protein